MVMSHRHPSRRSMPPTTSRTPQLSQRAEQARWEYALSEPARRMIAEGALDGKTSRSMCRWLAADRELASRVLRWCNTPLFNLSTPFSNLAEAIQTLGSADIARLTFLAEVRRRYLQCKPADGFDPRRLWSHSVGVGAVSAMIARTCGVDDPGSVMLVGTLHDIGVAVTATLNPWETAEVFAEVDRLSTIQEVEFDRNGWSHAPLGAAVLKHWELPDAAQSVALRHHDDLSGQSLDTLDPVLCCVVISNYLCCRIGRAIAKECTLPTPADIVFQRLDISSDMLMLIWHQLHETLGNADPLAK